MSAPHLEGPGLHTWHLAIPRSEVMWLRYVLEASEGLATLSGGSDGHVTLHAPISQRSAVEGLLRDLAREIPLEVLAQPEAKP